MKLVMVALLLVGCSSSDAQMDKWWSQNLYMKLIIEDQPTRFSKLNDYFLRVTRGEELSESQEKIFKLLLNDMNKAIYREYLFNASDEVIFGYSQISLRIQKHLEKVNPEACFDWLYDEANRKKVLEIIPPLLLQEYKNTLTRIVQSALSAKLKPSEIKNPSKIGKSVASKLMKQSNNFDFVRPELAKTKSDKLDVCQVSIAFTEILHGYPVEKISILTRSQFTH